MNFLADLHEGVTKKDISKLKSAYTKSAKSGTKWLELEKLYELYPPAEDDNNIFFLLYQDIKLRRSPSPKSWSEKLTLYHNFCCLIEELIRTDFQLPSEWLWDCLSLMVISFVFCTNEKWELLKSSANLDTLEESELKTFRDLYDYEVIEDLLLRLIAGLEAKSVDENTASPPDPTTAELIEVNHQVAVAALVRLYTAVGVPYKKYLSMPCHDALPPSARATLAYARGTLYMAAGEFAAAAREYGKTNKALHAACEMAMSGVATSAFSDLLRTGLRSMCARCDFTNGCCQEDLREQLIELICDKVNMLRMKQELLAFARIYRAVSVETLAELTGCEDLELVRAVLESDENVEIVANTVRVRTELKQESYTEILKKQTLRTKELLAQVKNF